MGNGFLDIMPKTQATKGKNILNLFKIYNFCTSKKKTFNKTTQNARKYLYNIWYYKGFITKIFKEILQLNNKESNDAIEKCIERWVHISAKKYTKGQ